MKILKKAVVAGVCAMMMLTTVQAAEIGIVNTEILNVRASASLNSDIVGKLYENNPVSVMEESGGWNKILYRGKVAYVFGKYVTPQIFKGAVRLYDESKYGEIEAGCLNVRKDTDINSEISRKLYRGQKVELLGESEEFYAIQEEDGVGFIFKEYVREITKEVYAAASAGGNVVAKAMEYIGTPYVYGGSSPYGFDCSGFAMYVYQKMGVSLNRTAAGQMLNGYRVSLQELQQGDLVFFGSRGNIDHVGIYVGNGNMVHAPYTGRSVCVESIYGSYYGPRLVGARRIF